MIEKPAFSNEALLREKNDFNYLQKLNADTESVATLCSPVIYGNETGIVHRNSSTKTVVPSSAGHNVLKQQKLYPMDSPKLINKKISKVSQPSADALYSGKTAVSKNAFSNGIRNISDISLFGLPGNYKVSISSSNKKLKESFNKYADQYNISSPGIDCSDIYEDISFESNNSINDPLYQNEDMKNMEFGTHLNIQLFIKNQRSTVFCTPDTSLHQKRLLTYSHNDSGNYESITDVFRRVRKELLFQNESKNDYNTTIFGQDLKKKDYNLSDSDKIKHILSYEMGYENNFISEKIKSMEKSLFDMKKNLRNTSSYIKSYISSFFCSTVSCNYFLLKENIKFAKRNPWSLFEEKFWIDYEEEDTTVSKPVLVVYPDDHEENDKKIDDEFKNYIQEKEEEFYDQEFELQTLKKI
ncbi:hypothetical protein ACO0R3_002758 [Hanseniaspora guilliermondii]